MTSNNCNQKTNDEKYHLNFRCGLREIVMSFISFTATIILNFSTVRCFTKKYGVELILLLWWYWYTGNE